MPPTAWQRSNTNKESFNKIQISLGGGLYNHDYQADHIYINRKIQQLPATIWELLPISKYVPLCNILSDKIRISARKWVRHTPTKMKTKITLMRLRKDVSAVSCTRVEFTAQDR
jgi:hypothetical protein